MSESATHKRTILLALDPATPGHAGIELVRGIGHGRSLLGLYVEDAELLEHARCRLATEIVRSGSARPLELATLERQLRAQSETMRRLLESEAGRLGLPLAFRSVRGQAVSELAAAAAGAEMLIVELPRAGSGDQSIWSRRLEQLWLAELPTAMYLREPWPVGAQVLAIVDTPADAEATARAAAGLARARDAAVTVLLGEPARSRDTQIRQALRGVAGTPRMQTVTRAGLEPPALAYLARTSRTAALVAPARLARTDPGWAREILRLTRCSIVLVNSAPTARRENRPD